MTDNLGDYVQNFSLLYESGLDRRASHGGRRMERLVHMKCAWARVPSDGRRTTEVVEELCDED